MNVFRLGEPFKAHREAGKLYHEFLRVDALSVGLYILPVGSVDPQQPHTEDEVSYVVSGRAQVMIGEEVQ